MQKTTLEAVMIINDWIHVVAGSFILLSLALGVDSPANPLSSVATGCCSRPLSAPISFSSASVNFVHSG